MSQFKAAVAAATVRDVMVGKNSAQPWQEFELVEVPGTATLAHTVDVLKRNHVQACPVRDVTTGELTSFISVDDLGMMQMFLGNSREWLQLLAREEIPLDDFAKRVHEEFATIAVKDAANAGEKNPWVRVPADSKLLTAVDLMTKTSGLHRLAVTDLVDGEVRVVGLVTQFGVLRYLAKLMSECQGAPSGPVSSFLPATREVITCQPSTTALEAMTKLVEAKVSGIAVTDDDDGKLSGVLSVSDILTVNTEDMFKKLYRPVSEFLRREEGFEVAAVNGSDSLADAARLMLARKVHRLFVLTDGKPSNVLSVSDLLAALVS